MPHQDGPADPPSHTEEQIREVTIGELKPLAGRIVLEDYDPRWPQLFIAEAARIKGILAERALAIEHVGSTSVPGLIAKPIIDVVLVVAASADEPAYVPDLEKGGYVLRIREPEWHEHRVLKGPDTNVNLHVFSPGCPEIARMLTFRDRLRQHPHDRERYADAKRTLAAKDWKFVQSYADAKTSVIEEILARASSSDSQRRRL